MNQTQAINVVVLAPRYLPPCVPLFMDLSLSSGRLGQPWIQAGARVSIVPQPNDRYGNTSADYLTSLGGSPES